MTIHLAYTVACAVHVAVECKASRFRGWLGCMTCGVRQPEADQNKLAILRKNLRYTAFGLFKASSNLVQQRNLFSPFLLMKLHTT